MRVKKIRTKFLLPVFGVLIFAFVVGMFGMKNAITTLVDSQLQTTQQLSERSLAANTSAKVEDINGNIDRMGRKALEQAAILSQVPGVVDAYRLAHSGDLNNESDPSGQKAREQLRDLFKPVIAGYKKETGLTELQLHFHLPTSRSLVRLWRDGWQTKRNGQKLDVSDDLTGFRKTVVEINSGSHKPISGIEVGRGGFAIRGLVPIQDSAGVHLGSAEVLLPFNALLNISKTADTQNYSVYMNADLLPIATKLQDKKKYPIVSNKYVLCASTDQALLSELVSLDRLDSGTTALHSELVGNYYVSVFPIKDFSGKQAGLMVMAEDVSHTLASLASIKSTGEASMTSIEQKSIFAALFLLVLIGAIVLVVTNYITKPLSQAVAVTEAIALGDLSQRIRIEREDEMGVLSASLNTMCDSLSDKAELAKIIAGGDLTPEVQLASEKDEFGKALQEMVAGLGSLISEINGASSQIVSGSMQVSDVSQALSQGATEQAASLQEITSSMTQIDSQTRQNAGNATVANQLSSAAIKSANEGNTNMQAMVAAMNEINEAGQGISKIIKVIDEIAFQTNLLALNAAVEAARAGQHGKGFAVVAEEVRTLAARSAKAAQETAALIEGSVAKADNGSKIAERTSNSLQEIMQGISKMDDLISEITTAANEQAEGISQVNVGLSQIDQVTQQNTASAEEGAAAAEELSSQAEHMRGMLARFKVAESSGQRLSRPDSQRARRETPQIGWGD
nr:methyl-accepting chemotaxis protein [uncultured Desulfuromonas sp.]